MRHDFTMMQQQHAENHGKQILNSAEISTVIRKFLILQYTSSGHAIIQKIGLAIFDPLDIDKRNLGYQQQ
jgi:hypothetical protein